MSTSVEVDDPGLFDNPGTGQSKTARAYGAHESHRITTDIWLTPRWILNALGDFDLDPCSAPDPGLWPTARHHITLPDDGLMHLWDGRVWLNPPYGRHIGVWLERMALHNQGTALIFARTETALFRRHVWQAASALLFLHRRVVFHHADGSIPDTSRGGGQAGAPSVLVAYGPNDAHRLAQCGLPGSFVSGWTTR